MLEWQVFMSRLPRNRFGENILRALICTSKGMREIGSYMINTILIRDKDHWGYPKESRIKNVRGYVNMSVCDEFMKSSFLDEGSICPLDT